MDYILEVNTNGCIVRDTIKIYVLSAPNISIQIDSTDYCSNDTIRITASGGVGNATFIWNYFVNGDTISDTSKTLIVPANVFSDSSITFYVNTIRAEAKDNLLRDIDPKYIAYYEHVTTYLQKEYPDLFTGKFVTFLDMCE